MDLDEESLTVHNPAGDIEYPVTSIDRNDVTEVTIVFLEQDLLVGTEIILEVSYSGPITNDMRGMYYSHYYDEVEQVTK